MLNLFGSAETKARDLIINADKQSKVFLDAAEGVAKQINKVNEADKKFTQRAIKVVNVMREAIQKFDRWATKRRYKSAVQVHRLEELKDQTVRYGKAYQRFLDGI